MNTISRRRALTSLAAIPALGTAAVAPAMAEPIEGYIRPADVPKMPLGFRSGPIPPDPMLEAINAYRAGRKAFLAVHDNALVGQEVEDEVAATTYGPAHDAILHNTPETKSLAGVREAIRLAFEEDGFIDRIAENALRSALAYLDREMPA
ncbi:hypothetical protein [Aerobium aerolatum]|uniref:Uncharacterized protein n=1 Tax=Aquamicrobium aerolatum DSM 21857 TaxID=1121003 RepID=A0A1I3SHM1_9HYPH|nr:hypothetical protein [Aquamicrobium aerolatum]SFJ57249.1 hypothetical protein SAMN03080618_03350 [Aquamicrobium aerolatum DSM 21857]